LFFIDKQNYRMNITELARILKITPQELRNNLPGLGYDIGQKAIKINRNVANRIIGDWPKIKRQLEYQKKQAEREAEAELKATTVKKKLRIPNFITVKEYAALADLPLNTVLSELMKNGVFVSLNEKIDFETAWLVGSELGLDIKKQSQEEEEDSGQDEKLKTVLAEEEDHNLLPRPPVIVVMGHVDHGKTKLLDAIRRTNVVEGEAGGITQHIGAYQVERKDQLISFIDTPGHEAFTAMRSRGARVADIAILIVAADDGVKPQTIEAYRIIEAAKIPFVVAINKVDKPDANIDKTKQELSNQLKLVPEDWGGKTVMVPISALKGEGISELLDMVLLLAEAEAKSIKANPDASAIGTIIESHVDKGAGPVATMLIQNGTLRVGDQLTLNNVSVGKVRALYNYRGEKIEAAGPANPAQIIGFKTMPQVGDILDVGKGVKQKFKKNKQYSSAPNLPASDTSETEADAAKKLNLVIRGDVLGSIEAIEESLMKINTREVKANIIHKGLGNITDGDIMRAEASGALIIGFNIKIPPQIQELAREKNIEIVLYKIIYDLINEVKSRLQAILDPTIKRKEIGRLQVLAIFKTENNSQVLGGKVISGQIETGSIIEASRGEQPISEGKLKKLQSGKEDVSLVQKGEECGIEYAGNPIIQAGDILTFYKEETITKKL
jgi:translation initiation factor IF-2